MAYYTKLITFWATQIGTTAQKLVAVNTATVTGSVPSTFTITSIELYNAIVPADFDALTSDQKQIVRDICSLGDNIVMNGTTAIEQRLVTLFNGTQTINNIITLAQAITIPWWKSNGYPSAFSNDDLIAAGLS